MQAWAGERFNRHLKWRDQERAKYSSKQTSRKEKEEMRMAFALMLKEQAEKKKSYSRTQEAIDFKNSTLLPFGAIVVAMGGWSDPNAVRGAMNHCKSCLSKGPDWYEYNTMSKLSYMQTLSIWDNYKDLGPYWGY